MRWLVALSVAPLSEHSGKLLGKQLLQDLGDDSMHSGLVGGASREYIDLGNAVLHGGALPHSREVLNGGLAGIGLALWEVLGDAHPLLQLNVQEVGLVEEEDNGLVPAVAHHPM